VRGWIWSWTPSTLNPAKAQGKANWPRSSPNCPSTIIRTHRTRLVGRGDSGKDDWDSLVELTQERRNGRAAEYLPGMPMLSDYLEIALSQFDISCKDFENEHR
jgi:hypothetical protein